MQAEDRQSAKRNIRSLAAVCAGLSSVAVVGVVTSLGLHEPWVVIAFLPVVLGFQTGGILPGFIAAMAYLYIVWLLVIKFALLFSPPMRIALSCCLALALLAALSVKAYERRVDWTSRGLNPSRPGFRPEAIILAGTFDSARCGMFEIRMNGRDYYYAKWWRGHEWKAGSSWRRHIALPGYHGRRQAVKTSRTTRGGGSSAETDTDLILVGRRLWDTNGFRGATQLAFTNSYGQSEIFERLQDHGPYKIPTIIRFKQGDQQKVFHVRKIEFQHEPRKEWFEQIKKKHFDGDPSWRAVDLEEPGPF